MKLVSKCLPLALLLGLASCSHFKSTDTVADTATTDVDRSIAQVRGEGISFNSVSEGQTVKLPRCGGTAKLVRAEGGLSLQIRGATCSNVRTTKGTWKLNGVAQGDRSINVKFDDSTPGERMVLVGSNAYIQSNGSDGNGDYLTVKIPARRVTLNLTKSVETKEYKMENCNGTISASINNGKVTIDISNSGCSKFDIVSNSGDNVKYPVKDIPFVSLSAGYSGNYTLPSKFYDRGLNGVVIRLVSPRLTEEQILVKFNAY
jgi:hypothetical protein